MALLSAIIGGASALGSAIAGAIGSSKANDRTRALLEREREDNREWYATKSAEDYTQRPDAQRVIQKQRELLDEQYRNARATNTVAGGTDESLALQKKAAADAAAQTMSDIASQASEYKDNIENTYRSNEMRLNQQEGELERQRANNIATAASQAVNAGVSMVGSGIEERSRAKAAAEPSEAAKNLDKFYNALQANSRLDLSKINS